MRKNLSTKQIEKYSRQIVLKNVGTIGQKKILSSNVLIVGAGGLGCPIVDYLSRAGVGKIGIVDYDKVDTSNIHRQSIYTLKDVGKYKVEVLKKKIIDLKIQRENLADTIGYIPFQLNDNIKCDIFVVDNERRRFTTLQSLWNRCSWTETRSLPLHIPLVSLLSLSKEMR